MKVVQTIQAPSAYIFDQIIESALYDIEQSVGKKIKRSDLSGYSYNKQFNKQQAGKISMGEIVENQSYQFSTETTRNSYTTTYSLTPKENGTEITVEETMTSKGFFQQVNDTVFLMILGWMKKKQIKAMLSGLETSYQASQS